ncbi:MAG: hypothetical protein GY852_01630, partial [bacterium]|nr:hypothetical protein [bacterium]
EQKEGTQGGNGEAVFSNSRDDEAQASDMYKENDIYVHDGAVNVII